MTISKVIELFGHSVAASNNAWPEIVGSQQCVYLNRKCWKTRKSQSHISIGTCTVGYGGATGLEPVVICPTRFIERRQIFVDCLHLLTLHEPGNELHIVPEVSIPGGNVDYFVVSVRNGQVRDFAGIEIQGLDTSGSVWPERQRLLRDLGVPREDNAEDDDETSFHMNWKMTAKTILVQMHHKIQTFDHVNKKLALVVQDRLLDYMRQAFNFGHIMNPASLGQPMHIHSYRLAPQHDGSLRLALAANLSTDVEGIAQCLGLQAEARVEFEQIVRTLQRKISPLTLFSPF
jgi:hypothetical protein